MARSLDSFLDRANRARMIQIETGERLYGWIADRAIREMKREAEAMLDLATAKEIAPGVYQSECPTTHQLYLSTKGTRSAIGPRPVVWTLCACCDAEMHTGEACDPLAPQYHLFFLEQS